VDRRALVSDHDEPAAVTPRPLVGAHELADPAGIQEGQVAKVDDERHGVLLDIV
jgi:hypothetical protein